MPANAWSAAAATYKAYLTYTIHTALVRPTHALNGQIAVSRVPQGGRVARIGSWNNPDPDPKYDPDLTCSHLILP